MRSRRGRGRVGHTDRQTDRQTDRLVVRRVVLGVVLRGGSGWLQEEQGKLIKQL